MSAWLGSFQRLSGRMLPASSSSRWFWAILAYLGLKMHHSHLCVHLPTASFPVSVSAPLCPLEGHLRPMLNPGGFHLEMLNPLHLQRCFFSVRSHAQVRTWACCPGATTQPSVPPWWFMIKANRANSCLGCSILSWSFLHLSLLRKWGSVIFRDLTFIWDVE